MPNFENAIIMLLENEGGYVDHPNDPGGETKFGISKRSYPDLDIKSLSRVDAIRIYKKDYWDTLDLDSFPYDRIGEKLFDISVNMGIKNAIKCLQRSIRAVLLAEIEDDGVIGPITKTLLVKCSEFALLCSFRSEVAGYYRSLKYSSHFLKGWLSRAYS